MKPFISKTLFSSLVAAALFFSAGCSRDDGKTAGQTIDDSAINAKVKAAFVRDPAVAAADIKVDTHLGAVQLSGWAVSPEEKARAEELAKAVPGVKSVENRIELKTDVKGRNAAADAAATQAATTPPAPTTTSTTTKSP